MTVISSDSFLLHGHGHLTFPDVSPEQTAAQIAHDVGNNLVGVQLLLHSLRSRLPTDSAPREHLEELEFTASEAVYACARLRDVLSAEDATCPMEYFE